MTEDQKNNPASERLLKSIDLVVQSTALSDEEKLLLFRRAMQMIENDKQEMVE